MFQHIKIITGLYHISYLYLRRSALVKSELNHLDYRVYGVLSKSRRGRIGAKPVGLGGSVMDCILTESMLITKIWLELADGVGFKFESYASGHPGSGTQMLR
jgi:hypothetical protein